MQAVAAMAGTSPDAPALRWRGSPVSYGELVSMADRAAARVADLPAGPVAIAAAKSPETVALILGCLAAGRPFLVPATTLPTPTLTRLFERAGCVAALAPAGAAAGLPADELDLRTGPARRSSAPAPTGPDDVTFMLTTSGSTGTPKIVPLHESAVDTFTGWAGPEFGLGQGRRVLNYAPLNFDLCLLEVWATLRHGGCAVLVEPERAAAGQAMLELLTRDQPHVIQAVPMLYELLLTAAAEHDRFDQVEHVILTGDSMPPERAAGLRRLFPAARFANVYGCTETNDSFRHEFEPGDPVIPLGRPLPGVHALLVTEDGAVLTGAGTGELLVSTPFQTTGYLHTPDAADRFTGHPDGADARRYFRSGDLVHRSEDGRLVLIGRTDFRIKVRGQQVNVQEVEQVLLGRPDVLEAAAVAVPDPRAGHVLHVVVRRRAGSGLNSLVLRKHCADRLPPAAIPARVRITDEPLPRTSTGKVDRQRISVTGTAGGPREPANR